MTLRHRITLLSRIFVTASMLSPAAWAQDIEPGQRYLLLATPRTGTMQEELDTAAAVALTYYAYNFIKIHRTLRVTPAMAAGVTNRLWDVSDLVALLEASESKEAA